MKKGDDLQAALRPIASLINKSEKARQKLAPKTWQHTMLKENLKALHIASSLMSKQAISAGGFARNDLPAALIALTTMARKTRKALATFPAGTAQHSLLQNRLRALHQAAAFIKRELIVR